MNTDKWVLTETIRSAMDKLSALVNDQHSDCLIVSEGAFDESMLFGTRDAYLKLALWCLQFICEVEEKSSNVQFLDNEVSLEKELIAYTNTIKTVFHELGDVWPIVAYMCRREVDRQRVLDELRST